jgi:hypothetical protein
MICTIRNRRRGSEFVCLCALVYLISQTGAPAGLIHQWTYDEASGDALDSVGGNTATLEGNAAVPSRVPGVGGVGSAMSFTGDNNDRMFLELSSRVTFSETQPFTVMFWYKGSDAGDDSRYGAPILANRASDNSVTGNIQIYADTNTFLNPPNGGARLQAMNPIDNTFFSVTNVSSIAFTADPGPPTVIDDDTWHHVAFVSDGNATPLLGDGTARVLVDGVTIDMGNYGDESNGLASARWDYVMAGFSESDGFTFDQDLEAPTIYFTQGALDDMRVYDLALSDPAIRAIMMGEDLRFWEIGLNDTQGLEFLSETGTTYALEYAEPSVPDLYLDTGARRDGDGTVLTFFDPTGFSTSKTYRIVAAAP